METDGRTEDSMVVDEIQLMRSLRRYLVVACDHNFVLTKYGEKPVPDKCPICERLN